MKSFLNAYRAEKLKLKHSKITWITFLAFAMGPVFGGLIMYLLKYPSLIPESGILNMKMTLLSTEVNLNSYFSLMHQIMAIGGIILFGFISSYIFGREYVDNTYRDLLSLPVSRSKIINAKFYTYLNWTLLLALSNLMVFFILALLIKLPGWEYRLILNNIITYFNITIMNILLGTLIAFFSIYSRNFLFPLGFLVITLIFGQIIPVVGMGYYFPWSIPAIYSGAAGEILKSKLNILSYIILLLISIIGFTATHIYFNKSDQT